MTLSLFPDNSITYMENLRASTDKILKDKLLKKPKIISKITNQHIHKNQFWEKIVFQNIKQNL